VTVVGTGVIVDGTSVGVGVTGMGVGVGVEGTCVGVAVGVGVGVGVGVLVGARVTVGVGMVSVSSVLPDPSPETYSVVGTGIGVRAIVGVMDVAPSEVAEEPLAMATTNMTKVSATMPPSVPKMSLFLLTIGRYLAFKRESRFAKDVLVPGISCMIGCMYGNYIC